MGGVQGSVCQMCGAPFIRGRCTVCPHTDGTVKLYVGDWDKGNLKYEGCEKYFISQINNVNIYCKCLLDYVTTSSTKKRKIFCDRVEVTDGLT